MDVVVVVHADHHLLLRHGALRAPPVEDVQPVDHHVGDACLDGLRDPTHAEKEGERGDVLVLERRERAEIPHVVVLRPVDLHERRRGRLTVMPRRHCRHWNTSTVMKGSVGPL